MINIKNLKKLKYYAFLKCLSILCSRCGREYKKYLIEEKVFDLINNIEEYQEIHNHARRKHESSNSVEKYR